MTRRNEEVSRMLDDIARLLTIRREDHFRIRAYTQAARAIETLAIDIGDLHRDGVLEGIPGVGTAIAKKVAEFLETGHLGYYEQLKRELAPEAEELLDVPSIGPERARMISERLGITHLIDLERAARAQRLRTLPGIGPVLERRIAQEAAELRRARTPAGSS